MSNRVLIDLRVPLRNLERSLLGNNKKLPEYVKDELVKIIFDVLIYEIEKLRERPDFQRLGNFYRDHLENDPVFYQDFVDYFFDLMDEIIAELDNHGIYCVDGFEYRPERIDNKYRSIVVKKFNSD